MMTSAYKPEQSETLLRNRLFCRRALGIWILSAGATLVLALWDFGSHPVLTADSGLYITLAQILVGIREMPHSPSGTWGYPFVLAPLVGMATTYPDILRLPSLVAVLGSQALLFWGWSWLFGAAARWRYALAVLFGLSPIVILQARLVLSDAVFLFWLLVLILLVEWGVTRSPPWWWWPATALVAVFLIATRTVGMVMLAGIGWYWLYRRGQRGGPELILLAALMVLLIGLITALTPVRAADLVPRMYWQLAFDLFAGRRLISGEQPEPYSAFVLRAWPQRLTRDIPAAIVPAFNSLYLDNLAAAWGLRWAVPVLGSLITLVIGLGLERWRRQRGLSALWLATIPYVGILMVWDWTNRRFLLPVLVALLYAFLLGLEAIALGVSRWSRGRVPVVWSYRFVSLIALGLAVLFIAMVIAYPDNRSFDQAQQARGAWLRQHTAPEDRIMSAWPQTDHLLTGRKVIGLPRLAPTSSPDQLAAMVAARKVRFVVIGPDYEIWQTDALTGRPQRVRVYRAETQLLVQRAQALVAAGKWQLVYEAADGSFRVLAPSPRPSGEP
jgi:hypothetical protein